jgi:hypothetical protein
MKWCAALNPHKTNTIQFKISLKSFLDIFFTCNVDPIQISSIERVFLQMFENRFSSVSTHILNVFLFITSTRAENITMKHHKQENKTTEVELLFTFPIHKFNLKYQSSRFLVSVPDCVCFSTLFLFLSDCSVCFQNGRLSGHHCLSFVFLILIHFPHKLQLD